MNEDDILGLQTIITNRQTKLSAISAMLSTMGKLIECRLKVARHENMVVHIGSNVSVPLGPDINNSNIAGVFTDPEVVRSQQNLRDEIFSYLTLLIAKCNEQYEINLAQVEQGVAPADDLEIPF